MGWHTLDFQVSVCVDLYGRLSIVSHYESVFTSKKWLLPAELAHLLH